MASVSSLSGTSSVAYSGLSQLRVQQAQRNAEQADLAARSLAQQAREAQRIALDAQENARSLSAQASQAETNAGQARLNLAEIRSGEQVQVQLSASVAKVSEALTVAPPPAAPQSTPAPVVNTQGQLTGTVVNTTA